MMPPSRPFFYTLRTTDGRQATIYVPPDDNPWQAEPQYARASFENDSHLAELRIPARLRSQASRPNSRTCRPRNPVPALESLNPIHCGHGP